MRATCSAPGLQSHTVTWMHRNLSDSSGLFLVILYLRLFHCCHSWCPFLHLSYPTHSLGSCAPRARLEPVMILKSLNTLPPTHTLPFPECQTGQGFFLPGLHGQFIFALARNICSGHLGADRPQHQQCPGIPHQDFFTMQAQLAYNFFIYITLLLLILTEVMAIIYSCTKEI